MTADDMVPDSVVVDELDRIGPKPSPCSPWCDVYRNDADERKWRTCTHRRRP